jgi:hypothetical protein
MHHRIDTANVIIAVIFSGLSIALPMVFHLLGLGSVFLPMYIPLAVGSFMLSARNSVMAGFFTPLASSLLTGMPPLFPPIAPIMMIQLSVFCLLISFFSHSSVLHGGVISRIKILSILLCAIVADRIIMALLYMVLLPLLEIRSSIVTAFDLLKGMPGIILMCVIVPVLVPKCVEILQKYSLKLYEHRICESNENRQPHI